MKKYLCILTMSCFVVQAQPGKEAWHWYFGWRSNIDFSSGTAVSSPGPGQVGLGEGCASLSDENTGQFLIGSFASMVINKNWAIMQNGTGLYGSAGSTEGSLIIKKPGSNSIYYVFTNDVLTGTHGTHYSVVDLSQANGLGKVTLKNQALTPSPTTEKMVGSRHCNGVDYWVITKPRNTNQFNSYLVSASGVNTTPVISNAGAVLSYLGNLQDWSGTGYMKISPNGKKLASGNNSDSIPLLEIFDFDNSSGVVSNPITISYPGLIGPYGLSFSPDNSKLYAAAHKDSTSYLCQYDLSSGVPATIIASQTLIAQTKGTVSNMYTGDLAAMQMAPDGKIYIARFYSDTLPVINNPNALGAACNFQLAGIVLDSSGHCMDGLPNFIDANYAGIQLNLPDIQFCSTFTTSIADAGPGYTNYQWSTGATTQTISISSPGQYWVTVTNDQGCQRTDTLGAYVLVPVKQDTVACDSFYVNVTQGGVLQYNWFDGNTNPVRNFTQSGNYYVDIAYVTGCGIRDSIDLTVAPSPKIDLGRDTTFCKGDLKLSAQCNSGQYNWSTGEHSPVITVKSAGTYWASVKDANGCTDSDTMIVHPETNLLDFVMPNVVTPNGDNINDVVDFSKYQFSAFSITVYDRWGQKVFSSDDPDTTWKPTGDDGTYFYTGQYHIECGTDSRTKELKGFITLVR